MSLKIFYGSRIEDLAAKLAEELKAERAAKGPFEFLKVAVANPNLGNWLKMKVLAKVPELGAGIEFPFAEALMVEVLLENVPQGVILELKQEHDYAIAIMDILLCDKRKEFSLFRRYITDGSDTLPLPDSGLTQRQARKAWQLSYRLAQMIDDYESYGSIALLSEVSGKTEAYTAEKTLADILLGPGGRMAAAGKASLRDLFERVRTSPPSGPARKMRLFGFSFLTPLMVEILAWIAKTHEVEVYCPHPFGLKETKLPELHACEARFEADLKEACGGMGVILGEEEVVADREKPSHVLVQVQDVLSGAAQGFKSKQDASVQIVGAPGIRREVELVYNAILGAVWEKNENGKPVRKTGMSFSDFAVIVPDMKAYRPMIEAVFEGLGQIPYGLIDVTSEDYCSYLGGFLALVELGRRGLSRRRLFDVLENPCVQRALAFGQDEVVKWRSIVDKMGAYDGYAKNESPSGYFNWEWALKRLRLGLVSDKIQVVDDDRLKSLPIETYDKDEATRFSEVVEMLFRKTAALKDFHVKCYAPDEHWCASWAGWLHDIMDNFLAVDPENALDVRMRSRIVKTLNELGPVEGAWNFELAAAAVEHAVSGSLCAKGGCIRSGVTIGGFRSLAYVPFKWIFVLGMGEGVFPHRDSISTLDVRSAWSDKDWKGLKSSDEDRARFLAAVLSARERLVITYQNRNIMDDAESYSSPLVRDMEALMSKNVLDEQFVEMEGFPLVESECLEDVTEEKFTGLRKSYSRTAWALAGRLLTEKKETPRKDLSERTDENTATDVTEEEASPLSPLRFNPKVLAEFVKEPFKAILKRKLGIATESYRDGTIEEESPLGIRDRRIEWRLQEQLVIDAVENKQDGKFENTEMEEKASLRNFENAVVEMQQKGMLPADFLGKYAVEKMSTLQQKLSPLAAQHVITDDDKKALTDPLNKKYGKVLCRKFSTGSITIPPDAVLEPLIAELRQMVVSCDATGGDKDKQHEISVKVINVADGVVGEGKWIVSAKDAAEYLRNVCDYYEKFLSEKGKGGYPSIKYESFRNAKKSIIKGEAICYSDLAKVISENKDGGHWGRSSFDSSVVVDELVKDFKRDPDAEQLRDLYENLFRLPMEGSFSVASVEKEEQK